MVRIRPFRAPEDYAPVARLLSAFNPEPITPERLQEQHEQIPAEERLTLDEGGLLIGHTQFRLIAADEQGRVVGYGFAFRHPHFRPGHVNGQVVVAPGAQRQGLGSRLADAVEAYAREKGATVLGTSVRDNLPEAVRFAEKRGYRTLNHMFESVLDLSAFDERPFGGVTERLEAEGLRFTTLADRPDPETVWQLYELDRQGDQDIPGGDGHTPPFEQWRTLVLPEREAVPELTYLAFDGDRLIGMTVTHQPRPGRLYTMATVVERAYRGRKIALALKLLAAQAARRRGAEAMRTHNDSRNGPMLAVNRKLGYQPVPGVFNMQKRLPAKE